jgi:hypothetical protein
MMSVKSACLAGLLLLGAFAANAQTYWSTDPNLNCGSYGDANGKPLALTAGGYACYVYGTLPWYAAGAGWGSSIRVSAPPSAPVAIFLTFVDLNGADTQLDFRYAGDTTTTTDSSASQALYANQPMTVDILGLNSEAPNYRGTSANGPVVVLAECPDADTCSQVQAQLIYSALPSQPWSLSAPVVWDWQTMYGWSAVGIDDGLPNGNTVSFVVYNLATDKLAHTYKLNVYDSTGALFSSGTTPSVPYLASYANVLRNVVASLPSGVFKLQLLAPDYAAFEALQFHGPSGTTLVAASEIVTPQAITNATAIGKSRHPAPSGVQLMAPRSAAR